MKREIENVLFFSELASDFKRGYNSDKAVNDTLLEVDCERWLLVRCGYNFDRMVPERTTSLVLVA